jgi:hypothetical protein
VNIAEGREDGQKLPSAEQTLLLRACLLDGYAARSAWSNWLARTGDPIESIRKDSDGLRRLLPLLFVASRRNNYAVPKVLLTTLRTAYVREQLRLRIYDRLLDRAVAVLASSGIHAVFLNGAVLGKTVYEDPVTRHCHDIDLLTDEQGMVRAEDLLFPLDFRLVIQDSRRVRFEHKSHLPLELYTRLRYQHRETRPFSVTHSESIEQRVADHLLRTLNPGNSLLQICSFPVSRDRGVPLGPFCDAWFLTRQNPLMDWVELADSAIHFGVERRCRTILTYLREELDAAVPQWPKSGSRKEDQNFSESLWFPSSRV